MTKIAFNAATFLDSFGTLIPHFMGLRNKIFNNPMMWYSVSVTFQRLHATTAWKIQHKFTSKKFSQKKKSWEMFTKYSTNTPSHNQPMRKLSTPHYKHFLFRIMMSFHKAKWLFIDVVKNHSWYMLTGWRKKSLNSLERNHPREWIFKTIFYLRPLKRLHR